MGLADSVTILDVLLILAAFVVISLTIALDQDVSDSVEDQFRPPPQPPKNDTGTQLPTAPGSTETSNLPDPMKEGPP